MTHLVHSIDQRGWLVNSHKPKLEPSEVGRRHLNSLRELKVSSFFISGDTK